MKSVHSLLTPKVRWRNNTETAQNCDQFSATTAVYVPVHIGCPLQFFVLH